MTSEVRARQLMLAQWDRLGVSGWEPCLTPPLPETWPPVREGAVIWYCYAEGFRPGLMDGVEIAAPWGRIVLFPGGEPAFELLGAEIEELGIQGIRPLLGHEMAGATSAATLVDVLQRASEADQERAAESLNRWRSLNGRIAGYPLVARHLPQAG
jgi:hypothetical protein